ncbi:MAG: methionyl-tRNA formyltransferase [Flavobacteriales bacterium]|nr:methionyl-tRNA formyltransferase [Flavobacteriales bacterium]
MKVVFMGTPEFAVASLDAINKVHEVVGVVTVADKPAGRGKKIRFSAVKEYALKNDLQILQPEKLKDEEFVSSLKSLGADLFVVVAFRMLPEVIWNMPPKGTINLHGSLLPDYRGAAPLNWAIINGDRKTGATTFFIEKEIDTGNIIDKVEIEITKNMNVGDLHDRLMLKGADLLVHTINNIGQGKVTGIPQAELMTDQIKEAPKIFKETCRIDWNKSNSEVHNHIRGLSPYPAAWSVLIDSAGKELGLKLFKTIKTENNLTPGIIKTDGKGLLQIGCGSGSLQILELQIAGKKRMDIKSFLNGIKLDDSYKCI